MPYYTELEHYQLSATVVKSERIHRKSQTFSIEPCIFNMDFSNPQRLLQGGLKITREKLDSPKDGSVTIFQLSGNNYHGVVRCTNPGIYSLKTTPTSVQLEAKSNGTCCALVCY